MRVFLFSALLLCNLSIFAQEIVELPQEHTGEIMWQNPEKQYFSQIWQNEVVTNVAKPTMEVFRPSKETNTGTAVIIAPGGGLYALSIESEGNMVAKWLTEKGITAFVLRYHLVPSGEDGVADITRLATEDPEVIRREVTKVMPFSIQDGLNAIKYVRDNAEGYGVKTDKIGFMGFSAGGAVAMGVAYNYTEYNRPDFLVPVYFWTDAMPVREPRADTPPMVIICATDDPLGLAKGSIDLYTSMLQAEKSVALHMYSKGGHGFGMNKQGLPSDTWIERFYDWSLTQGLVETND